VLYRQLRRWRREARRCRAWLLHHLASSDTHTLREFLSAIVRLRFPSLGGRPRPEPICPGGSRRSLCRSVPRCKVHMRTRAKSRRRATACFISGLSFLLLLFSSSLLIDYFASSRPSSPSEGDRCCTDGTRRSFPPPRASPEIPAVECFSQLPVSPPSLSRRLRQTESRAGPLWNSVAAFLGWGEERARDLVAFGGVYYKPAAAPATAKPKRELDPDRQGLCERVSQPYSR